MRELILAFLLPVCLAAAEKKDPQVLFERGVERYAAERYGQSINLLEQAAEARPNRSEYRLWLGRAYGRRADEMGAWRFWTAISLAKKMRLSLEKAVELDSANEDALWDLFDFYLEAPGLVGGGEAKAEALIKQLTAIKEASGERAWAQIEKKRNRPELAEQRLRRAVELEPDGAGHFSALAALLAEQGKVEESERLFQRADELRPNWPDLWLLRARTLIRAGRGKQEARELLERYLKAELKPDSDPKSVARKLLKEL